MPTAVIKTDLDVLDLIVEMDRMDTVDKTMDAMWNAVRSFGYETLILTGLNPAAPNAERLILAKRWPAPWFDLYISNGYLRFDPVARMARQSVLPFEWSEAPYDAEKEPGAVEVMNRASDFRMTNGLVVPIHGITGFEACVSLGGKHLDLTLRSKAAVYLLSMYGFHHIRRMLGPVSSAPKLTPREREVLVWSAQGKSAWEIGEILNISQRTVEQHAANACEKLGAMNRMHAVTIALRDRLIEI